MIIFRRLRSPAEIESTIRSYEALTFKYKWDSTVVIISGIENMELINRIMDSLPDSINTYIFENLSDEVLILLNERIKNKFSTLKELPEEILRAVFPANFALEAKICVVENDPEEQVRYVTWLTNFEVMKFYNSEDNVLKEYGITMQAASPPRDFIPRSPALVNVNESFAATRLALLAEASPVEKSLSPELNIAEQETEMRSLTIENPAYISEDDEEAHDERPSPFIKSPWPNSFPFSASARFEGAVYVPSGATSLPIQPSVAPAPPPLPPRTIFNETPYVLDLTKTAPEVAKITAQQKTLERALVRLRISVTSAKKELDPKKPFRLMRILGAMQRENPGAQNQMTLKEGFQGLNTTGETSQKEEAQPPNPPPRFLYP